MTTDFAWLAEPYRRRSELWLVDRAIRRGWLAGPGMADRRAALLRALAKLLEDPGVTPRETIRVARIFLAMQG